MYICGTIKHTKILMKELLRLALINKYKSLGYSQKAINAVLEYLEKSVKEESEIEEAVNGVGPILKSFQSEIDTRVTAAEKLRKEKEEEEKEEESAKGKSTGVDSETGKKSSKKESDEVPEWAKGLIESNKALTDKLQAIESGKTSDTRKQTLEAKIKDAPEKIKSKILKDFAKMSFEKDEDFDIYLEETATDVAEISQSFSDSGLGQSSRPFASSGAGAGKEASKEEVDGIFGAL
ncbi:MAG TPA: hypothetical protein VGN64_23195 [Dyadobacter sp.]|nr:hypothetical protein [Dyadobacter sp.]